MTNFIDIEIEGFGSIITPRTFLLDRGNSLNVITGRVGSGKTSILNALVWGLFGKSLKEKGSINTLPEYQGDKYRGTKVTINLKTNEGKLTIIRCKSFKGNINIQGKKVKGGNNIFITLDDKLYESPDGKGKINNQNNINKIIGYSFELFKNAIMFGQKQKRIIQESGPDKKKIFEEAFDMLFIEEAKNNATNEKKDLTNVINNINKDIDIIDERLDSREKLKNKALDKEEYFTKYQEKDIKHYHDKITENKKRIKFLDKQSKNKGDIEELKNTKTNLMKTLNKKKMRNSTYITMENTIKDYQSKLSSLRSISSKGFERCPECGSKVNDKQQEINRKHNKDKIKEIEKNIKTLKDQFMLIEHEDTSEEEKMIKDLDIKIAIIEDSVYRDKKNTKEIDRLNKQIDEALIEIKLIKEEKLIIRSTFYDKLISKLINKRKKKMKQLDSLNKELEVQNWLINDPLSNNGLKAYIFNNLLSNVNNKLDDYSKILGFTIEFGIDLESHRKDFYQLIEKEGVIIPYEDLSGGQQQLVDTSVAFAVNDVISDIKQTNVLFLDEPFESLGIEEIEIVSELIYDKSKNKTVYLITHHQSFSTTNAETIYVKLDKNKNTIIQD